MQVTCLSNAFVQKASGKGVSTDRTKAILYGYLNGLSTQTIAGYLNTRESTIKVSTAPVRKSLGVTDQVLVSDIAFHQPAFLHGVTIKLCDDDFRLFNSLDEVVRKRILDIFEMRKRREIADHLECTGAGILDEILRLSKAEHFKMNGSQVLLSVRTVAELFRRKGHFTMEAPVYEAAVIEL